MAPVERGKLKLPWQLYRQHRLEGMQSRLRLYRTLLDERSNWLKEWEDRAASAVKDIEEEAEDQSEEQEKRSARRRKAAGDDNPRG